MPQPNQSNSSDENEHIITVFANVEMSDSQGGRWRVTARTSKVSYCSDVFCTAVPTDAQNADFFVGDLCHDETMLEAVNAELRRQGYAGEDIGRSELGMQEDNHFALEGGEAFQAFLHTVYGWEYAEGMAEWQRDREVRTFKDSFDTVYNLLLSLEDGSRWQVPLMYVLMTYENMLRPAPTDPEAERKMQMYFHNPSLKGNVPALLDWVRAYAETVWPKLKPYAHMERPPTADLFMNALRDGNCSIR